MNDKIKNGKVFPGLIDIDATLHCCVDRRRLSFMVHAWRSFISLIRQGKAPLHNNVPPELGIYYHFESTHHFFLPRFQIYSRSSRLRN